MSNLTYFDFNFNNDKDSIVSIYINGGLGNQLFQIATAFSYAIKSNKKLIFKYSDDLPNIYNLKRKSYWNTLFSNKLNVIKNDDFSKLKFLTFYEKNNYKYDAIPYTTTNLILHGYFQSFKYFDNKNTKNFLRHLIYSCHDYMYTTYNLYNSIKSYFTKITNNNCDDDDMVSMHFRRTDYILTPHNFHRVLDFDYYIKALNIIKKKNIVIFSDDIEWCKKNINKTVFNNNDLTFYFVDINNVEIEFILLSFIKHNIISNSTFSLMASYISYYESKKIIIAPKKWLSDNREKKIGKINEIYHDDITYII